MPLHGLSLNRQIAETAAAAGLAPTDDQIERVNLIAQALGEQADDGRAVIDGLDAISFISRELAAMPVVRTAPSTPSIETDLDEQAGVLRLGNSVQVGRHDAFAQAIRATQRAENVAAAADAAAHGNPWAPASWNRTRQAVLTNLNPDRAAEMRAAAGVPPK